VTRSLLSLSWGPMPALSWLALAVFAGLLYGVNLGGASALTDHEMLVGGVAKQMARDGTWGMLWIGDRPWLEKPPLPHSLAALSGLAWGGFDEVAVRFPFAVAGVGVVLVTAWLAASWYGATVGLLAGLIQASTLYMLKYARLAEAEILLLLIVAGALAAFWRMHAAAAAGRSPARARLLFWALLGLTNLVKGPGFGAFFVVATVAGWLLWRRDRAGIRRLWSPAGIGLAVAVSLLWPAIVAVQGHGGTLVDEWWMHTVTRGAGDFGDPEPPWYYPVAMLWQMLPWTPLLLAGAGPSLARAWRNRDAPDRFVWCWGVLPVALLSVPAVKHHQYILHALPAFAPVMALGLVRIGGWYAGLPDRWRARSAGAALAAAGALLAGSAVGGAVWWDYRAEAWLVGGALALGIAAMGLALRRRRIAGMGVALMVMLLLIGVILRSDLIPRRDPSGPDRNFLLRVAEQVPDDAPLVATGGTAIARHVFYVDRPVTGVWSPAAVPAPADGPVFVIAQARDAATLAALGPLAPLDQSARARFERSPEDRYTLYRIDPPPAAAAAAE